MSRAEELLTQGAAEFECSPFGEQCKKHLDAAHKAHAEFLKLYPFRQEPAKIDELTPEALYDPGPRKNYFFLWLEKKLRALGGIAVGSAQVYRNAVRAIDEFKELVRVAVDDSKSVAEKIDVPWDSIPGFGGDRLIAKKLVASYYPDNTLPIFKTAELEHFATRLESDADGEARKSYGKPYSELTLGEKWELLTRVLLAVKERHEQLRNWDNAYFMYFLYHAIPGIPPRPGSGRPPPEPFGPSTKLGLLWEPRTEQEVLFLFAKFHRELGFPYIVNVQPAFPDATVLDNDRRPQRVEFEIIASHFLTHRHPSDQCDVIVCWENDLPDAEVGRARITALKDALPALGLL